MRTRLVIAVVAALVALGAAWRERERARNLALPVLADPSLEPSPAVELQEGPGCTASELMRLGVRITALLPASDGDLFIGTFDAGLYRVARRGEGGEGPGEAAEAPEVSEVPGLRGRERFVNALVEHDGLVWAATQGGLLALDRDRRAVTFLAGEGVTAIARAGTGLYAGTARGLFRVSVEAGAEALAAAGPSGEPLRVTALAEGATRLWIGTASGAYSLPFATLEAPLLAREARWHPLVFGDPPAETNVVTALAPVSGGAVAGTDDGGLVRLRDGGGVAAVRFADARSNEVNPGAAAPVPDGTALLGTQGGGLLFAAARGDGLAILRVGGLGRAEVSAVHVAGDRILAGTAEGGVIEVRCARHVASEEPSFPPPLLRPGGRAYP